MCLHLPLATCIVLSIVLHDDSETVKLTAAFCPLFFWAYATVTLVFLRIVFKANYLLPRAFAYVEYARVTVPSLPRWLYHECTSLRLRFLDSDNPVTMNGLCIGITGATSTF